MATLAFDTNKAIKTLVDHGMEKSEAEGLVEMLTNSGIATTSHVELLIKDAELRMQKFLFTALTGQAIFVVGLTVSLIKLI